jgi:hypothetical protein
MAAQAAPMTVSLPPAERSASLMGVPSQVAHRAHFSIKAPTGKATVWVSGELRAY